MLKKFKYIFNNTYIQIAGLLALFLSPLADYLGGTYAFGILASILICLFVFGLIDEYMIQKKLQVKMVHIPIVIKVDDGPDPKYVMNNLIEIIEEINALDNYEEDLRKYFGINLDTFIFEYNGSIYDFDRLMSFARIIKYKLNQIEKQLNGRVKFHVAYYKRPSIGFLIGTLFRTDGIVVYQNNDFENKFYKVTDINSRKYKERIKKFTKYTVTESIEDKNLDNILVVINSASHSVNLQANSLIEHKNIIKITLNENGTIPYDNNWTEYASEIYNILNNLQTRFKNITIAHSMPEAISIILGMALENYWNINITQYDNNDYKDVYTMNKIKYYF